MGPGAPTQNLALRPILQHVASLKVEVETPHRLVQHAIARPEVPNFVRGGPGPRGTLNQNCSGKQNQISTCSGSLILGRILVWDVSIGLGSRRRPISWCFYVRSVLDGQFRVRIHILGPCRNKD